MYGLISAIRALLRPAGFIGTGFFVSFIGLSWIVQQDNHDLDVPAPILPARSDLKTVDGVISEVSLPADKRVVDAIAVEVKRDGDRSLILNVPDAILKNIGYLELKGKPVEVSIDSYQAVYEVHSGDKLLYSYDDAVARHHAAVERYEANINRAREASRRLRAYGSILLLLGATQFVTGIIWWRRRGAP